MKGTRYEIDPETKEIKVKGPVRNGNEQERPFSLICDSEDRLERDRFSIEGVKELLSKVDILIVQRDITGKERRYAFFGLKDPERLNETVTIKGDIIEFGNGLLVEKKVSGETYLGDKEYENSWVVEVNLTGRKNLNLWKEVESWLK